jgi:hypothetical protein
MNAGRKSLPHDPPLWVDVHGAVFFMTCCVKDRSLMPFASPETARGIRDSILHRVNSRIWWVHAATIMPDHMCTWFLDFRQRQMSAKASATGNDGRRVHFDSIGSGIFSSTGYASRKISKRKPAMFSKIRFVRD